MGYGQVIVKYPIDCDSILPDREGIHLPLEDDWFMASINLDFARNWKNKDSIKLSPFTTENLQNGMTCIEMSPPSGKYKDGWVKFATLNYWEHGEYGMNVDSAYEAEIQFEGDILVLRDKLWIDRKPRGQKHKYKVVRTGRNCIVWVKLNPTTKKLYPREIPAQKAKNIISVKNY